MQTAAASETSAPIYQRKSITSHTSIFITAEIYAAAVHNVTKWNCHGTISWEFMRKKLRTWYPPVRIFNFFSILAALFASRVMCPRFCSSRFSCDSRRSFLLARFARVYRFWLGRKSTYVMQTNTS